MSVRVPSRRSIRPLVVSLPSVPASSFLSLGCGNGATPDAVSITVAELVKEHAHAFDVLVLKFRQQQRGLLSMQDACEAISMVQHEMEELCGAIQRAICKWCGSVTEDDWRLARTADTLSPALSPALANLRGDEHLYFAPTSDTELTCMRAARGPPFKRCRAYKLYRALRLARAHVELPKDLSTSWRDLEDMSITFEATTRLMHVHEDEPPTPPPSPMTPDPRSEEWWTVMEGGVDIFEGPYGRDIQYSLDRATWLEMTPAERLVAVHAGGAFLRDEGIPIGLSEKANSAAARQDLDHRMHGHIGVVARNGIAQALFHLLALHEMCGSVYGSAIIATRFLRFYVLAPNRIAVELPPTDGYSTTDRPPFDRMGLPYQALFTSSSAYERIPLSFTTSREIEYPTDPAVVHGSVEGRDTADAHVAADLPAELDSETLQTFVNYGMAAVVRIASLNYNRPLTRLPTTLQDGGVEGLETPRQGAALPADLLSAVEGLSLIAAVDDDTGSETSSEDVPDQVAIETGPVDVYALEQVLSHLASYVPVTSAEMDVLIAQQLEADLVAYKPVSDFPTPI